MTYGIRIKQARELKGLTQSQLAERIGIRQPAIAQMEAGLTEPTDDHLQAVAFQTGFPQSWFRRRPAISLPMGSLLYRARRTARPRPQAELFDDSESAKEKTKAHRLSEMFCEVAGELAAKLQTIPVRVPESFENPTTAARLARSMMGIGPDGPVVQLTTAVEKAGVLVLALPIASTDHDAFSTWVPEAKLSAVMATFAEKPGDRLRFSAAHELGHLVMHRSGGAPRITELEEQADEFAAEFLMPEQAMRQELVAPLTLTQLAKLKTRWRVSIAALIERGADLGVVSRRQHSNLWKQIKMQGWDKEEPVKIPVERPRALNQMIELLYGTPPDYRQLAGDLCMPVPMMRELVAGGSRTDDDNTFGKLIEMRSGARR